MTRPVAGSAARHVVPALDRGLDALYRDAHDRIDLRTRALLDAGRDPGEVPVTACPGWSVHGVVSHMSGITADALAGRLAGVPDEATTSRQVTERAGRPTVDVLDEWAANVEPFAAAISQMDVLPAVADVLVHEGDILEALGEAAPARSGWLTLARTVCAEQIGAIDRPGSLTVAVEDDRWLGGSGADHPIASVEVDAWELFRAVFSRRSRRQVRDWAWTGTADPWLGPLTVFGTRDDDQPRSTTAS